MRSNKRILVTTTVVGILLLGVTLIGVLWLRPFARERYVGAFPKIKVGDSKQSVLQLLGEPTETTDCYSVQYSEIDADLKAKCAEQFWYRAFLEEWIIVFDKDGKVLLKGHSVSQ